jgi:nucleoid DNA-binding protein
MAKNKSGKSKGLTKSAIFQELAEKSGASRKQVASVFDSLGALIKRTLKKDGDVVTIPGLLRLKLRRTKAVKGGQLKPNPFKPGEMITTKDKPARNVVKAYAVKALKESVK